MEKKYNPGDTAYIVESSLFLREVKILKVAGEFVTLRFTDSEGGVRLRVSRLFPTKEAAEESIKTHGK